MGLVSGPVTVEVPVLNPLGIQLTCLVVLLLMAAAVALDLYLEATNRRPLGHRVATWARNYPFFMAGLALILGMMVGHFFFALPDS
jgi:hypothetical protein